MIESSLEKGGWRNNKWFCAAIPALLLHCSTGTVYCWSVFSQEIADHIGFSKSAVEWAFSLAIFFLGMSAAFLGNLVERDIKRSSLISTLCFTAGMLLTGFFIWYGGQHKGSVPVLVGLYVSYGAIMGIGLGTGYLSPVKTLMLWFRDKKGLATGLAVAGFGAAKAIASPIMSWALRAQQGGVYKMFLELGCVYCVMMFVGHLLLKKPDGWHEPTSQEAKPTLRQVLSVRPFSNYLAIWFIFYINITCGLALISQEKQIVKCLGLVAFIGSISAVSAIFNAAGRLGFSAWADRLKDRNTIYRLIFLLSLVFTLAVIVTGGISKGYGHPLLIALVLGLIFFVNAGYGGGFSNVPALLADHYGMNSISAIHGITLSAWAFAGLSGNQLATFIVNHSGRFEDIRDAAGNVLYTVNPLGYQNVLWAVAALFAVALAVCLIWVRPSSTRETPPNPSPVSENSSKKS